MDVDAGEEGDDELGDDQCAHPLLPFCRPFAQRRSAPLVAHPAPLASVCRFEVEVILAHRAVSGSSPPAFEYLVSWKGYSAAANTWEPVANIMDATLIGDFEARQAAEFEALDEPGLRELLTRAGMPHDDCETRDALLLRAPEARAKLQPQPAEKRTETLSMCWVACDKCEKWRRMPAGARAPPAGEFWECSMNPPDMVNSCLMPQETVRASSSGMSVEKLRARMEREAERDAARQKKLAEKQEKEAARAAEKEKKEAERAAAKAAKEEQALLKEAARELARQQRVEEAAAREAERQEELRKQEEAAKRQRINKFFFVKTAPAPAAAAASARPILLRDGKLATPFHADECTTVAAPPHRRPPSCAEAPGFLAAHVDMLFGTRDTAPGMPAAMRVKCRRERRVRVSRGEARWKWSNMKLLRFDEDVRPPYRGTFTRKRDRGEKEEPEDEDAGANPFAVGDDFGADAFGLAGEGAAADLFGVDEDVSTDAPTAGAGADADADAEEGPRGPLGNGGLSRRRPFGRDTSLFDYDVDSEGEWEPEEEGEDLASDEEAEKGEVADEGEEGEEDDWLVPDDPMDAQPGADEPLEAGAAGSAAASKGSARLQPTLLLAPCLGSGGAMPAALGAYRVVKAPHVAQPGEPPLPRDAATDALLDTPLERREPVDWDAPAPPPRAKSAAAAGADTSGGTPAAAGRAGAPARAVPADQVPRLLELLHGNTAGMARLVELFQEATPEGAVVASKAQIEKQIRAVATKGTMAGVRGACWCVADETWEQFGLTSPAPRAVATDAAAKPGETLTSCVLPSRATDVINPAMRSFFSKSAGTAAGQEEPPSASAAAPNSADDSVKQLFTGQAEAEEEEDEEEAERREEEEAIRAAQAAATAKAAAAAAAVATA